MGAIQNAANQLAQTGLGAAVAGKHLQQQAESIKEQEATKELAGLNAISVAQSQLNEVNTNAEKLAAERKSTYEEYHKNMSNWGNQADYKETGKHPNGLYNWKQLEMAKTAAISNAKGLEAIQNNWERIEAQRAAVLQKAEALKEIYGKEVVDIQGAEAMRYRKARQDWLDYKKKYPNVVDNPTDEGTAKIHGRLQKAIDEFDKPEKQGGKK